MARYTGQQKGTSNFYDVAFVARSGNIGTMIRLLVDLGSGIVVKDYRVTTVLDEKPTRVKGIAFMNLAGKTMQVDPDRIPENDHDSVRASRSVINGIRTVEPVRGTPSLLERLALGYAGILAGQALVFGARALTGQFDPAQVLPWLGPDLFGALLLTLLFWVNRLFGRRD